MGLLSFLNRKADHEATLPPVGPKTAAPRSAPVSDGPPAPALCREEVIDDRNRLCGYRFALHSTDDRVPHPETEFIEALVEAHIPEFAERRLAVVPLTLDAIVFKRHLPLVAPHTVFVFDRAAANMPANQLAGRMLALKEAGCKVGLRGFVMRQDELELAEAADVVFLHLGDTSLPQFQQMTRELRALYPELALAADGVQSWDEQRMCLSWGVHFCLGDFLTKTDKEDPDGTIDQGRLTAIEMLNLLRTDGELEQLAEVAKHDPGITFQLLKWANSPSNGQHTTITSLSQAIVVLGRNNLYRWLTVSMFRIGKNRDRDESLLEVALARARFLELISKGTLGAAERDELFLVGLLSLFDVLLGIPMPRVLEKMHLSDETVDVLLRSSGPYGQYLMLALIMERGMMERAAQIARSLGIDPTLLGPTNTEAFQWAQESLKQTT